MRSAYIRLLLAVLTLFILGASSFYQTPPLGLRWSPPDRIPGFRDESDTPYLVADQNRTIHAFNSEYIGRELAIFYNQWTPEQGWLPPIDILLSPEKRIARIMGAFLDQSGIIHVIFFGGDDLGASIYYSWAYASQAYKALAWAPLQLIGEYAASPAEAALIGDGDQNLYVVFSGNRDGFGLYSVRSADAGKTWTEASIVYLTQSEVFWPSSLTLELDDQGILHSVWAIVNDRGNGESIYYSRLDEQVEWSQPQRMAERNVGDYEVDWPSIVSHDGQLILVYDDSFPATRWMRRSSDSGQTWTEAVKPFPHVGEYGHAAFAVDGQNNLHMFLGNRTTNGIHGMWHSLWLGDRWSNLEPIVSGPSIRSGLLPRRFDPTAPRVVTVQGNLLMVVWRTDPSAGENGLWYSYSRMDMPQLPVVRLANPPGIETPSTQVEQPGAIAPTRPAVVSLAGQYELDREEDILSPSIPLVVGAIPVAFLLVVFVILINRSRVS